MVGRLKLKGVDGEHPRSGACVLIGLDTGKLKLTRADLVRVESKRFMVYSDGKKIRWGASSVMVTLPSCMFSVQSVFHRATCI